MENKYYTPDIQEFHVGFEYGHSDLTVRYAIINLKSGEEEGESELKRIWIKYIFSGNEFDIWNSSFVFRDALMNDQIRVKYLDIDDINSLGFIESNAMNNLFYKEISSNNEKLIIELIQYESCISRNSDVNAKDLVFSSMIKIRNAGGTLAYVLGELGTSNGVLYYGECKNKSELKQILKMIGYGTK